MKQGAIVAVIIPALNEELSIGSVLSAIPRWVDDVIVVDNGSIDNTAEVARSHGARIVSEPRRGYGSACLAGITALMGPDVVVFLDGDYSDYPEEMDRLVDPIADGSADVVIGSRVVGQRESGALTPQAHFGNWLACTLMRLFWNMSYTDLGPFRAIRYDILRSLNMQDRNYGWTVEMQIKAACARVRIREKPVSYRRRIGKSKVSGTVKGVVGAGTKILFTIFRFAISSGRGESEWPSPERLIIFTRYPEPGKTKTRLIPALGSQGAADLHRQMTEHVLSRLKRLKLRRRVSIEICYDGGNEQILRDWLGPDIALRPQGGDGLGERMARAFRETFAEGAEKVVLVGTDCPGLNTAIAEKALRVLSRSDVVLGPANDGGYYLIGLKRVIPQLFEGISWGAAKVLEQTLKIANDLGLSTALVDTLDDVDRVEDLHIWEKEKGPQTTSSLARRISVIIPALNEESFIAAALASLRDEPATEIIVVDAGSADGTATLANSCGARVVHSSPGRGSQMNAGAAAAMGDILIFLHADTSLPKGFGQKVRVALSHAGTVAGAFELRIDSRGSGFRILERLVNWRSRRLRMPYGDQAIFLTADLFHSVGGFPEIPVMEDFEFVSRLRQKGKIEIISSPAITSARRWNALGLWRTTLVNQVTIAAYYLGFSLQRIACWRQKDKLY